MVRGWDWYGDGSVVLVDIPLACCGLEIEAAIPATAVEVDGRTPAPHRVVTVSGTITTPIAEHVAAAVEAQRGLGPTTVVAFGACPAAGGPYWDAYSVVKGLDQLVQVDRFVPGCPPTPSALASVIEEVRRG
ncbi:MAG TPA: proton-conducting membrane transporter [Propionibacteriaceae bacterium]|nr:proton-conducting membrane transporter [Propionibacteriaceae bacterium]